MMMKENIRYRGVPRILPGGMHIFGQPTPSPPDLDVDQNNADPKPWAQLSKDYCLIYNYVNTEEQQTEEKCCNFVFSNVYNIMYVFNLLTV
jgi:hypothetical protein